ncbi:MAG TPA: RNA polymerase subunit sigma [Bacteroidetes bacterium]|nr:RNA polymerase subunit sigma [Bacteroidota bacterium]
MTQEEVIKKENDQTFEKEFLPHADSLYNFAYHLVYNEDDARDLVQDTYMKGYRFIKSYERGTNAKAWLFKILKNSFINEYRRKTKTPRLVDYEDFIAYEDVDESSGIGSLDLRTEMFQNLVGDEISGAINSLPADFRTVILLCDIEEFSYEEIAKIVDIPVGTVRSRLNRARNMLKDKLRNYAHQKGIKEMR